MGKSWVQQLLAGSESGHEVSVKWGSEDLSYSGTKGQSKIMPLVREKWVVEAREGRHRMGP